MSIITVETLDEYIRLQEESNNHQIRAILEFKSQLSIDILKKSIKRTFEIIPILGSSYVRTVRKSYWDNQPVIYNEADYFTVIEGIVSDDILLSALCNIPSRFSGPQLKATLLRKENNDILCIVINHMAFDGTGMKSYLNLLSEIYTKEEKGEYKQYDIINSERKVGIIFKNINFINRIKIMFEKGIKIKKEKQIFSTGNEKKTPQLFLYKIDKPKYNQIILYCKKNGITMNDFMLALFYKAIFRLSVFKINELLTLYIMIDLRKYDKLKLTSPFSNLSSMSGISITYKNMDMTELVKEVHWKTQKMKSGFPGLKSAGLLDILYRLLPGNVFENILKKAISSVGISTTNLGIIGGGELSFGNNIINDAYIITALKNEPSFQFTFSTFNDSITISSFGNYSERNTNIIRTLYNSFDNILSGI